MKKIYVECKPDKLLVELVTGMPDIIIHAAGKGRVVSRASRGNAVDVIDEDREDPNQEDSQQSTSQSRTCRSMA